MTHSEDLLHDMNELEYNNRLNDNTMSERPDDYDSEYQRDNYNPDGDEVEDNSTALSVKVLSMIDTNKAQREQFVQEVIDSMQEGKVDPLKIHVQVKCMEQIIKMFTDGKDYPKTSKVYKELVLDEATKHGKKFEYHNAEFKIGEVGTKYDWSKCGDAAINELLRQQAEIDAALKERQEFLKTLPAIGIETLVDDEVVRIYPPSRSSTTSVSVSLNK